MNHVEAQQAVPEILDDLRSLVCRRDALVGTNGRGHEELDAVRLAIARKQWELFRAAFVAYASAAAPQAGAELQPSTRSHSLPSRSYAL